MVPQKDIARRVTTVRQQLSDCLKRESANLSIMMVSAQMKGQAGVMELQKELSSLVSKPQTDQSIPESNSKPEAPATNTSKAPSHNR